MLRRVSQLMFLIAIMFLPAAWPDDYCLLQCYNAGVGQCSVGPPEQQDECKTQLSADCRCQCYPRTSLCE
jgi:hypothetical protein